MEGRGSGEAAGLATRAQGPPPPGSPNLGALDKPPCSLASVSPLVIGDIKGLSWAKDTTHLHKTKQKRE